METVKVMKKSYERARSDRKKENGGKFRWNDDSIAKI